MTQARPRRRSAFTLVELLVVIAIIGVLVALLFPAIQAAREAGRRTQCLNNLHQWAVAMHLYHAANKRLPIGAASKPRRQTWVPHLWAHVEEGPLASQNDLKRHFFEAPMTILSTDLGLAMKYVPLYYCPNDGEGRDLTAPSEKYHRRRGNYVVNWGNQKHSATEILFGIAPFSSKSGVPRPTELADVTDGTSNTLMMSETLRAPITEEDHHGDIMNDDGHFRFQTSLTPNTSAPDVMRDNFAPPTNDPLMPSVEGERPEAAARSRHPGGVNAVYCDGAGRFFSNDVDALIWRNMGTMNGEEVVDDSI